MVWLPWAVLIQPAALELGCCSRLARYSAIVMGWWFLVVRMTFMINLKRQAIEPLIECLCSGPRASSPSCRPAVGATPPACVLTRSERTYALSQRIQRSGDELCGALSQRGSSD